VTETFADTFYFLALINSQDSGHERAVLAAQSFSGVLVTTDWVLTEFADALSDAANRRACVAFIEDLRRSKHVQIEPASRTLFDAGWVLYKRRPDKNWSRTDCTSIVVMTNRGIHEALTADRHFEQAGFKALLR
jgi:uncharacterized protein